MKLKPLLASIATYHIIFAISLLLPLTIAFMYHENYQTFAQIILTIIAIAGPIFIWGKNSTHELNRIDGFLLITLTWFTLCLTATVPFIKLTPATLVDSWFEAVSGLTTTGAEVFKVDNWSMSLKIYHQFLQFLGGLGIVVLGLAIMPLLGQSASTLLDAEHTSSKEQRLTPRISKTAKQLWKLYASMVAISAITYHIVGLSWFDSWSYSFTTFSTGGFGIYSDSLMHYKSQSVYIVASIFAILGSLNFAIIFTAIRQKQISPIIKFSETRYFAKCLILSFVIVAWFLLKYNYDLHITEWFASVIMMITTTGLQITEFNNWPSFLAHLMLATAIIGGSSGSTTGGMKMARVIAITGEINALFKQLLHPRFVIPTSGNKKNSLIHGFIALNIIVYSIAILVMIELGYSLDTAFAAVTACLTNVGISIGKVSSGYQDLSDPAKFLLSFLMLLGRLEATTILIMFSPYFWREI